MNSILIYLLKSASTLAAIYLVYLFFLRRDTFFTIGRFYLLGTLIVSFMIPFIPLRLTNGDTVGRLVVYLSPAIAGANGQAATSSAGLDIIQVLAVIYFTGAAIFLARFLAQLLQLIRLIRRSDIAMHDILRIVYTDKGFSPFSFFNYVFVNRKRIRREDLVAIMAHEEVHVRQGHSFDLLLFELACVVQWFNPFLWMALRDIRNVHEYLADEGALSSGVSGSGYRELIMQEAMGARLNYLTNNFNVSPLKNRILMMTKPRSAGWAKGKLFIALPVVMTVMIFFAGNTYNSRSYAQQTQTPQYNSYETQAGTPVMTPPRHHNPPQDSKTKDEGKEYQKIDKQPEYPGGFEAMTKFVLETLKYPEEAKAKGIQGKVAVNFTVKADGSLTHIQVMKSLESSCDKEAIRVVSLMPKWKPGMNDGKPLDVSVVLPIQFKLDTHKEKK